MGFHPLVMIRVAPLFCWIVNSFWTFKEDWPGEVEESLEILRDTPSLLEGRHPEVGGVRVLVLSSPRMCAKGGFDLLVTLLASLLFSGSAALPPAVHLSLRTLTSQAGLLDQCFLHAYS